MEPCLIKFTSLKKLSVLPGFVPTFTFTLSYLTILILIPLGSLILYTSHMSFDQLTHTLLNPRVIAAFKISFGLSILATILSAFFGTIIAWVLSRYNFFGKKLLDALIDLPFAMPTAVSGITLATLYSENGWIGYFLSLIGVKVAYTPLGIVVALIFIGFPFIVRSLQPSIEEFDREMEEASICLGASRFQTITKVIFPELRPSLLTGFSLALARSLGEYGSVIFIAGNLPYFSEIVPLLIVIKLEQYDYYGATSIALMMLICSFILLLGINILQHMLRARK